MDITVPDIPLKAQCSSSGSPSVNTCTLASRMLQKQTKMKNYPKGTDTFAYFFKFSCLDYNS